MKNTEQSTLKNGNIRAPGKPLGAKKQSLLELHRIGEERCRSHYDMLDKLASEGDKECAMFLLNKVLPPAKGSRTMKVDLGKLETIEDVGSNQSLVFNHVSNGDISIEEGERLFSMIESRRKTIEVAELAQNLEAINNRMKQAGI